MNRARNGPGKGGALDSVTGIALARRMIVTCMWGVSDPCGPGVGRRRGQPNWGRSRPSGALLGCDSGADSETGGTERRRRQTGGR
jgi:hypothetical protein